MDYRQLVRAAAERNGLDPNLAEAVMAQESGGRPNAVSPVGATGLMQLMPGTAKDLGVDPNDPLQNIEGGVKYLKQQVDKFGVAGGLAAYNAGPGRFQKVGGQFNALPEETRNYVPSVMNRTAEIAQQRGGAPVAEAAQQPQALDLSTLLGGFEKARAANDTDAVNEIGGLVKSKFESALSAAKSANDAEAVKEIEGAMGKYGFGAPTTTPSAAKPAKAEKKTNFLQDVGIGAADALSFGFADEAYAKAVSALRGTKYEDELKNARAVMDQAGPGKYVGLGATFLLPGIGVVRAANTAGRLGRAAAGAATGAIQGGLYGAGSAEGDLVDRAKGAAVGGTVGALTGGTIGALVPSTVKQEGNAIIKKAGGAERGTTDSEIIQVIGKVIDDPNRMINGKAPAIGTKELNGKVTEYFLRPAQDAVKALDKGPEKQSLSLALNRALKLNSDDIEKLRTSPAGNAVADVILQAQRADKLTAAVPANTLASGVRAVTDWFLPSKVSQGINAMLGQRVTRENVAAKLTPQKVRDAASLVLKEQGPSAGTQGRTLLENLAKQAVTKSTAKEQVSKAAREQATQVAEQLRIRNLQLGIRSNPGFAPENLKITGGPRAVLQYYGRLADSTELAKGLKIIEKTDPYLAKYIAELKQDKLSAGNKRVLTGLTDRLLMLRDQGILKPYMKP